MFRTIEVPVDQVDVRADIGKGRIVRVTLLIEEIAPEEGKRDVDADDPFGRELDELLAMTEPVNEHPADVSREAMYLTDEEMGESGSL